MTEKYLYDKLIEILDTLDKGEYPEIASIIEFNISQEGKVFKSAFDIASRLHDADNTQILPKEVASLLIEIYLEEIDKENVGAMTDLGSLYYTGRCGELDYKKAVHYYTMADKLGERQATENLGYCYYYGRTGEVDYKKAFHYFVKGALDGHLNSLYKIGDMYKNGYYVEKDEKQAFYIYSHCYNQMTEISAQIVGGDISMRLGDVYYYGIGTQINLHLALKFYQESEQFFYVRINNGDYYAKKGLEDVIQKQNEIRALLMDDLPGYEWRKKSK